MIKQHIHYEAVTKNLAGALAILVRAFGEELPS